MLDFISLQMRWRLKINVWFYSTAWAVCRSKKGIRTAFQQYLLYPASRVLKYAWSSITKGWVPAVMIWVESIKMGGLNICNPVLSPAVPLQCLNCLRCFWQSHCFWTALGWYKLLAIYWSCKESVQQESFHHAFSHRRTAAVKLQLPTGLHPAFCIIYYSSNNCFAFL